MHFDKRKFDHAYLTANDDGDVIGDRIETKELLESFLNSVSTLPREQEKTIAPDRTVVRYRFETFTLRIVYK